MKRVLFFTHNLNKGGAEKTVRTLSAYINKYEQDMESYVCVVYDNPEMHSRVDNLIVMEHKSKPSDNKLVKACHVFQQIGEMREIKKKYGIDVCVSLLPGADIINVLSSTGEQQIVSVRNEESFFTKTIFKKIYVKTSYNKCDKIVALSERVRQDVIHYFNVAPEKVTTIHCAASHEKESRECSKEFLDFIEGKKVFINVGRLDKQKGQAHLIRAFNEVCKKRDDAVLVILGEGELQEPLQKLIDKLGIGDKALLLGNQFNPADYMRKSDVFVLSSNVEGMPNVLVEALQCNLPVVSTDCGAAKETLTPHLEPGKNVEEIVVGEYGILVPTCEGKRANLSDVLDVTRDNTREEVIMGEAMLKIIEDDSLRAKYKEKASECVSQFDQDTIMKKWVGVIK